MAERRLAMPPSAAPGGDDASDGRARTSGCRCAVGGSGRRRAGRRASTTSRSTSRSTRTSSSGPRHLRPSHARASRAGAGREQGRCYTPAAMTKNLVIVESPAKARTIERYLGADYQVLASYGHVRDLPENPGKGKLGVDVDHDFAPEYVIRDDRRKQVSAIEKAARARDARLPRHRPRPRGRGDRVARRRGGQRPRRARRRRVTFSEITEGAIRAAFAQPARHRPAPRRRPADPPRSSTGWSATRSARCCRARSAAGCPPAASSRSPCAWSSSASARSARSPPASTGRSRRRSRPADGDDVHRGPRRGSTARRSTSATARRPSATPTALRALHAGRRLDHDPPVEAQPGAAVHDQHAPAGGEPQARLQPQADDVASPSACTRASTRPTATSA